MTITAIMFAGDDEDVVESSVRHNLHYVDAILVIGIDSRDETAQITARLAAEGLPVAFSAAGPGTTRAGYATATLRRLAGQEDVRHVACLGADQFIEGDPAAFRDALLCDPFAVHVIGRIVRVPTESDDWCEFDPYRRVCHRRMMEIDGRVAAILPHRLFAEANVGPDCLYAEGELPDASHLDGVVLAHLPVRNPWQFGSLVSTRIGEITMLAEAGIPDRISRVRYWLRAAASVRRQHVLNRSDLRDAATVFETSDPVPLVEDAPVPFSDHEIRYPAEASMHLDTVEEFLSGDGNASPAAAPAPPSS